MKFQPQGSYEKGSVMGSSTVNVSSSRTNVIYGRDIFMSSCWGFVGFNGYCGIETTL